jgi:Protein of unknown function (DUF2442)
MAWLTCVRALPGLRLYIETEDGQAAELDVHAFISGLDELRDPALFARVSISEFGELIWPNRDCIGPDTVREVLAAGEPYAVNLRGS